MSTIVKGNYKELVATLVVGAYGHSANIYTVPNYPQNEAWYIQGFFCLYRSQYQASVTDENFSIKGFSDPSVKGFNLGAVYLDNVGSLYLDGTVISSFSSGGQGNRRFSNGHIGGGFFYSTATDPGYYMLVQLNNVFLPRNSEIRWQDFSSTGLLIVSWYFNIYKEVW